MCSNNNNNIHKTDEKFKKNVLTIRLHLNKIEVIFIVDVNT